MKRIVILVVLVALAGVAGVVVRSSSSNGGTVAEIRELVSHSATGDAREEIHETYELDPGARVDLSGINGAVQIETSDTKIAEVTIERTATSQEALNRRKVYVEGSAGELRIHGETVEHNFFAKLFGSKATERVKLRLPRQIALYAKGVNGSVLVGELDGPVELGGINGKVNVANAVGVAALRGINGNIFIGLKSIEREGVTLNGINGNIELQLPADVNADFEARGMNGRLIADLPNASIDKSKRGSYWGRIGDGGNGISAKGINGNIRLTRAAGSSSQAADLN